MWSWLSWALAQPQTTALAEWFAAIGTVGAFAIGIALYAKDRRDRIRVQADQVITILERVDATYDEFIVRVHNASSQFVFRLFVVFINPREGFGRIEFTTPTSSGQKDDRITRLAPGDQIDLYLVSETFPLNRNAKIAVLSWDASNRQWWRNLETQKYIRRRTRKHSVVVPRYKKISRYDASGQGDGS